MSEARMTRRLLALGIVLVVTTIAVTAQQPDIDIPPVERTRYSIGGLLEVRPALVWLDTDAALLTLHSSGDDAPGARSGRFNSRFQLDVGYQRNWFNASTRTVVETAYASGVWTGDAAAYEAFVSLKPSPSLTVDAGKRTLKWGKGYLWNPAAFLDRRKSPEDPALALEGFVVLSADSICTFTGPLQVLSFTPVLLPVSRDLNASFGQPRHLNVAGKLYLLLYDTDIDVMALSGGSRPARFGFDLSRNLRPNIELHGEWTHIPHAVTPILGPTGTMEQRDGPATSVVAGLRYLTNSNTTFVADYYRNGNGYTSEEIETFFELVDRAHDALTTTSDDRLVTLARRASEAGYGRIHPGRHYVYGRVTQPDALGVLYLTLGASAIVNADDGSHSVLPEVQYKATQNLELRWLANIQRGGTWTEFGEKPGDLRMELRIRYYF
jgi:hypothetical protein